ncbi:hypothetical protein J2S17_003992 [Cytobacillus purgationiresistens]|uniref:Uncharacterized protein n=1 Tax=Cytobacillus purgationiresistens TaxID=863449 RepID=A0ABU0AM26_9BACI|nr:hypothetical protein [Cytobacillus purgationiresistens]
MFIFREKNLLHVKHEKGYPLITIQSAKNI